jgi:hypothetical protein
MKLVSSPLETKRFRAIWPDGTHTDFGQKGGSTFIDHRDEKKRMAYIARHSKGRENWNDPRSAGALARYILWEKPTLSASLAAFRKRFNL